MAIIIDIVGVKDGEIISSCRPADKAWFIMCVNDIYGDSILYLTDGEQYFELHASDMLPGMIDLHYMHAIPISIEYIIKDNVVGPEICDAEKVAYLKAGTPAAVDRYLQSIAK